MKVKKLIKKLLDMPQDKHVYVTDLSTAKAEETGFSNTSHRIHSVDFNDLGQGEDVMLVFGHLNEEIVSEIEKLEKGENK